MTPPNIFFRPILPKFEEIFEIVVGDFERWPMLPVRKTNTVEVTKSISDHPHTPPSTLKLHLILVLRLVSEMKVEIRD